MVMENKSVWKIKRTATSYQIWAISYGLEFNRYVSSNVWKLVSDELKKLKLIEPFKKKLKI